MGAWIIRTLRDDILPEEKLIAVIVVSLPSEDGQRETDTTQQATEDRCPALRGKGQGLGGGIDAQHDRSRDGGQRQVHAVLECQVGQRHDTGRGGQDQKEPRPQKPPCRPSPEGIAGCRKESGDDHRPRQDVADRPRRRPAIVQDQGVRPKHQPQVVQDYAGLAAGILKPRQPAARSRPRAADPRGVAAQANAAQTASNAEVHPPIADARFPRTTRSATPDRTRES